MRRSQQRWIIFTIVVLFSLSMLSACNYRRGWVEVMYTDRMRATYDLLDGQHGTTVTLAAEEVMTLEYDLEVTKGSLSLQVVAPDKDMIWEGNFHNSSTGSISVSAPIEGRYRLLIIGDETSGSFDLHWEINDLD